MINILNFIVESFQLDPKCFIDMMNTDSVSIGNLLQEIEKKLSHGKMKKLNDSRIKAWARTVEAEWLLHPSNGNSKSILMFPVNIARQFLNFGDDAPVCKTEKFLQWNRLSLSLGEDLFTTAYMAWRKNKIYTDPSHYQWSCNVKSDFYTLNRLIDKKELAENHMHLYGSSPHFDLSWLSLMNYPANRKAEFDFLCRQSSLKPLLNSNISSSGNDFTLHEYVKLASCIRVLLFLIIYFNETGEKITPEDNSICELVDKIKMMLRQPGNLNLYFDDFSPVISSLLMMSPYKFKGRRVDYWINHRVHHNKCNAYMSGERKLYYLVYKSLLESSGKHSNLSKTIQNLFYLYILIKQHFSKEFIQKNDRTGFENFQSYQDRKVIFLRKASVYEQLIVPLAITENMKENGIDYLEARIKPDANPDELSNWIKDIDAQCRPPLSVQYYNSLINGNKNENKHFYVLHFIKHADELINKVSYFNGFTSYSRYRQLREKIEEEAKAVTKAREKMLYCAYRIFGIDAASNEINCRPEVFAQAFCYLKNHMMQSSPYYEKKQIPDLKITYHVGEDFYDLLDGLRAVDEAVTFLKLRYGDRIGHGLALGLDPDKYYERTGCEISIPKQNLLDNIAWLLHRINQDHLSVNPIYHNKLKIDYKKYYQEVFNRQVPRSSGSYCSSEVLKWKTIPQPYSSYIKAWKLRGYSPESYNNFFSIENVSEYLEYVNRNNPIYGDFDKFRFLLDDHVFRETELDVYNLNYLYQHDIDVKVNGSESTYYIIEEEYVNLVKQLQQKMRNQILSAGIAIETNPSSNILISGLEEVSEHPIFSFFPIVEETASTKRLNTSVNTDDQGVFYTSLLKEYTLLARCLQERYDSNNVRLHSDDAILQWIERLIKNSQDQSFYSKQE